MDSQVYEIVYSFILVLRIWKLRYSQELTSFLLRSIRDFIDKNFDHIESSRKQLVLLYSYLLIGTETNNNRMIQKSTNWYLRINKKNITTSLDILLYSKITNMLGYSSADIHIHLESIFDVFVLLDSISKTDNQRMVNWLNLWALY